MNQELNIRIWKVKGITIDSLSKLNYSKPENYMALMEEIWKVDRHAIIHKDGVSYFHKIDEFPYTRMALSDDIAEAICLAWLEIFEKEDFIDSEV